MFFNPDILHLKLNKNYDIAYSILKDILEQKVPDLRKIERLCGLQKARTVQNLICDFITSNPNGGRKVRPHNPDTPMDITLARNALESDSEYQKMHSAILLNASPDIKLLEKFYGKYSPYVLRIFWKYVKLNLKRKCEIGAATHLNRVGALVYQLKMNDEGTYDYSATAALHDSIEDLVNLRSRPDGYVDADDYDRFLDENLPAELRPQIKILTNYYNLILTYVLGILEETDKAFSLKNITGEIEKITAVRKRELSAAAEKMIELFRDIEVEGSLIGLLRWECYKKLYLEGIAAESSRKNDHRIYEIKGVDLSDNAHGKGALSIDARIRNINKNLLWGVKGYRMKSTWKPFNAHIQEIIEDAYQSAEYLILSDMLRPHSPSDFMMSALLKIIKLQDVFYI